MNDSATGGKTCYAGLTDRELAQQAGNGGLSAYTEVFRRYMPLIRTICRYRIRDQFTASETANDVLAEVLRCIGKYANARGRLSTWIARVAHNICTDANREQDDENESLEELCEGKTIDPNLIHYDRISDVVHTAHDMRMAAVAHAISDLNDREQYVLRLRMLGHTIQEISGIIGTNRNNAKQIYWRAIQKIKGSCGVARCHVRYNVAMHGYCEEGA